MRTMTNKAHNFTILAWLYLTFVADISMFPIRVNTMDQNNDHKDFSKKNAFFESSKPSNTNNESSENSTDYNFNVSELLHSSNENKRSLEYTADAIKNDFVASSQSFEKIHQLASVDIQEDIEVDDFNDDDDLRHTKYCERKFQANYHKKVDWFYEVIDGCKCDQSVCVCSRLGLNYVPTSLPYNITVLYFDNNNLTHIKNRAFCNYTHLEILDLSHNKILQLRNESFNCLHKLKCLTLYGNKLEMNNITFPSGVFKELGSLLFLKLNNNTANVTNRSYEYPDQQLSDLRSLHTLYLDGLFNKSFGPGFAKMTSLEHLNLAGYTEGECHLGPLRNSTFVNLSHLKILNISDCNIVGQYAHESGTFTPLRNLKTLDISYNRVLGFVKLGIILSGLKHLKILNISAVVSWYSKGIDVNASMVQSLPRSITHLVARENCFETVLDEAFDYVPENLTHLDLGINRFLFGEYLQKVWKLENLLSLDLNGAGFLYNLPHSYTPDYPQSIKDFTDPGNTDNSLEKETFHLQIPPRLQKLDLSIMGLKYKIYEFHLNSTNDLSNVKLKYNYLPLLFGPIYGLHNLAILDLRSVSLEHFSHTIFQSFPKLTTLLLGDNSFGEYMAALDEEDKIFQNLSTLTTFDMSNCQLTNMPNNILAGMVNLENIHLEKNKMWIFNVSIFHMPNLTLLNLSHSQINNLLPTTRESIDRLCTPKSCQIRVDLSHCPIICECNNLDFLKWMVNSKAFEPSFHNYMCKFADSSSKYINDSYQENLRLLDLECQSHIVLFIAISSATFILFCCIIACIVYKFRLSVKHFYYTVLYKFNHQHENKFRYDVCISYSCVDVDFVVNTLNKELRDRGLKLYVQGLEFATANWMTINTMTAINQSRKTLVILTRNFLTSNWCNYEFQFAKRVSKDCGRQFLVFLLKESIPSNELVRNLRCHIKRNKYIYPQPDDTTNDSVYRVFWDKLAADLKR